jgi:hypothetical protein
MRKVILYLQGENLFSTWESMPGDTQNLALLSFGDSCQGKPLRLGGIDLGTVTGFRTTPHAVGLIVEWNDWIEQGQII